MTRRLGFSPEAQAQLLELQHYIDDDSASDRGELYIERILNYCEMLATFPALGSPRDDIRPGLRVIGFERRVVIAYVTSSTRIDVLGVHYGGQAWERHHRNEPS